LPSCSKCVSRGIECQYRTPKRNTSQPQLPKKKKKKKSTSQIGQPYFPATQVSSLTKTTILDSYYSYHGLDFPVIDREELEMYISDTCPSDYPNKKEVEVLFLAIRALCEQTLGHSEEIAKQAIHEAKTALAGVFDRHSNYYVACAYCYMAFIELASHDVKTAKYFLKSVEFYFSELDPKDLNEKQQLLKRHLAYANSTCNSKYQDNSGNIMDMIRQIPELYYTSTGQRIPPEWNEIVQQEITESNFQNILDVVETVVSALNLQTDALSKRRDTPVDSLKSNDILTILISNGLKIAILTKAGQRKDLIEEYSLRITLSTNSDLFPYIPVTMISYVALAARVHYHILRAIESGQRNIYSVGITSLNGETGPIDYYEILTNDFRALNILKKKLKVSSPYYDGLSNDIAEVLQRRQFSEDSKLPISLPNDLEATLLDPGAAVPFLGSLDGASGTSFAKDEFRALFRQ